MKMKFNLKWAGCLDPMFPIGEWLASQPYAAFDLDSDGTANDSHDPYTMTHKGKNIIVTGDMFKDGEFWDLTAAESAIRKQYVKWFAEEYGLDGLTLCGEDHDEDATGAVLFVKIPELSALAFIKKLTLKIDKYRDNLTPYGTGIDHGEILTLDLLSGFMTDADDSMDYFLGEFANCVELYVWFSKLADSGKAGHPRMWLADKFLNESDEVEIQEIFTAKPESVLNL